MERLGVFVGCRGLTERWGDGRAVCCRGMPENGMFVWVYVGYCEVFYTAKEWHLQGVGNGCYSLSEFTDIKWTNAGPG